MISFNTLFSTTPAPAPVIFGKVPQISAESAASCARAFTNFPCEARVFAAYDGAWLVATATKPGTVRVFAVANNARKLGRNLTLKNSLGAVTGAHKWQSACSMAGRSLSRPK